MWMRAYLRLGRLDGDPVGRDDEKWRVLFIDPKTIYMWCLDPRIRGDD